jgi:hypothetical protein
MIGIRFARCALSFMSFMNSDRSRHTESLPVFFVFFDFVNARHLKPVKSPPTVYAKRNSWNASLFFRLK